MDLASIKKFFASLTLQKLVPVILIVVIGLLLVKLLLKLFDRVLERSRLERTMFSFLRAAMRALLYTILVLVAASSLGVDVTSLVAILSVVSLAISLAVQNALSNVVGSVTLLTTHPFHVGDFVEIGSDSGTVEEISVSYTKLATVDGKRIYIPNSDAASARICNYSVEGRRRVDLYIGVSYDAPAEKVREALLAAAQHPKALRDQRIDHVLRIRRDGQRIAEVHDRLCIGCDGGGDSCLRCARAGLLLRAVRLHILPGRSAQQRHGSQRGGDAQAGRGRKRDPDVPAAAHRLHGLLEQIVVHGVHQAEKPVILLHRNTPSSSSLLRSRARVRNSELRMRPELAPQASAISAMLSPYQ